MNMTTIQQLLLGLIFSLRLIANSTYYPFEDIHKGWNSNSVVKIYFHHSELQRQWAWELLGKHPFKGDEKVLDFGCGDGKISSEISRLVSRGALLGVDISPEMLHLARIKFPTYSYPNLQFRKTESLDFS